MKKSVRSKILFTFLLMGLLGCSTDDNTVSHESYSLAGKWHLASFGGGITGQFTQYNKDIVTWTFDTINEQIHIKNKRNYFGPNAGIYPYELRRNDDDQILYFNDSVQGILYINESELLYYQVGLLATFKR